MDSELTEVLLGTITLEISSKIYALGLEDSKERILPTQESSYLSSITASVSFRRINSLTSGTGRIARNMESAIIKKLIRDTVILECETQESVMVLATRPLRLRNIKGSSLRTSDMAVDFLTSINVVSR